VEMVLAPFLLAMHYLHTRGIMHRDIKPENVSASKTVRVCVFVCMCVHVCVYYLHTRGIMHRDIKPENVTFETVHARVCEYVCANACVHS